MLKEKRICSFDKAFLSKKRFVLISWNLVVSKFSPQLNTYEILIVGIVINRGKRFVMVKRIFGV